MTASFLKTLIIIDTQTTFNQFHEKFREIDFTEKCDKKVNPIFHITECSGRKSTQLKHIV